MATFFRNLENVCGKGGQQTNGKKMDLVDFVFCCNNLFAMYYFVKHFYIMNFINKRLHDLGNDSGGFDFEFSQPD